MPYSYQGNATVITASRHLGTKPDERLNESAAILMTGTDEPKLMRLSFETPLDWPCNANFITVNLPDGSCVSGTISDMGRPVDGRSWVTFTAED